ncbi:mechanosensitive ion channel domain-containing protein [Agrobacterium vaccinii]|uniref:mechanosensitive ion channel domain-containing protein n=1 Tax=Agrobacterium vaccinii TaxID=2735528 RepID=UPI001E526999|nr:mechanosensitive ion channel domain-containing protein [Agrobacterium vaccinii]UHS59767.1 mechanosensitive ion channel [Agrobacterium vaccinii]
MARPWTRIVCFLIINILVSVVSAAAQQPPAQGLVQEKEQTTQASKLQDLIDVLRDDKARQTFLDELQEVAGDRPGAPTNPAQRATVENVSIGQRIAEVTRQFAETAVSSAVVFSSQLAAAPATFANLSVAEGEVLLLTLRDLALVIVVTYGVFVGLRLITRRIDHSFGKRAATAGFFEKAFLIGASAVLDIGIVFVAWAAGYLAALTVFGELGRMDIQQTLYLNAFTVVQLAKVAVRTVLSPSTEELRLIRISKEAAKRTSRILAWIISILGYGQLLLQPVLADAVSLASGQAVSALVALVALIIAITATIANRQTVTDWLLDTPDGSRRHHRVRFIAKRWHWPVLAYLAFLFFVVITGPADRLIAVLSASAQALAAIIVGFAIADWLARAVTRGVTLPDNLNQRLPLLERRVNGLVPRFLTILRLVILALVVGAVLSAIGIFDLAALMQSRIGLAFTGAAASVFIILLVAYVLWLALTSWVDYRLNPSFGSVATSRETTLLSLLRNAATIVIVVIALMFALSQMGLDIAPLLASAGVLGLAIGFGAQKLVQDVINGVFIQLENAINVGDVITVGSTTGTVERLTIRSVSLRDVRGAYHIISFSSVEMVTNLMRDFSYHVGDIGIAYRENVEDARAAMFEAFEELRRDPDINALMLGDMEWFGVQELADSAVIIRVRIKTLPGKQWGVGRALNGAVKRVFDARGIEIPFPHQTLYFGVDKNGDAPPAFVSVRGENKIHAGHETQRSENVSTTASDAEDLEN